MRLTLDGPITLSEIKGVSDSTILQLGSKLGSRIVQVTEEWLSEMMESFENDHNLAFVQEKLKRSTHKVAMWMINDKVAKVAFKAAVARTVTSLTIAQATCFSHSVSFFGNGPGHQQTDLRRVLFTGLPHEDVRFYFRLQWRMKRAETDVRRPILIKI